MPQPQQAVLQADPVLAARRTLCVVMERYSFTLQALRQHRMKQRPTGVLFTDAEVKHVATGLAHGLAHLYTHGFSHR